ncbi:hypothetical protein PSU4_07810 [Pseudonocardia sulfidoxydans NBRC 16205]|uniref:Uncharacterized protein n=1 Tax=Pseudonocardia sulfidoxydans NBRC 16205 TaxID=1223511 RepID=A0A511DB80_9PSEU|nr:hypothetical protein PSU4_07810 [Pseudonocardia sulfidoxydans NBRC 16205]
MAIVAIATIATHRGYDFQLPARNSSLDRCRETPFTFGRAIAAFAARERAAVPDDACDRKRHPARNLTVVIRCRDDREVARGVLGAVRRRRPACDAPSGARSSG